MGNPLDELVDHAMTLLQTLPTGTFIFVVGNREALIKRGNSQWFRHGAGAFARIPERIVAESMVLRWNKGWVIM